MSSSEVSSIPVWAPIATAFFASMMRGLTSFGDGVTYQALFSLLSAVGFIPPITAFELRKSVLYSSLMQSLTMPVILWQSRSVLPTIAGYIVPMIVIAGGFVVVGAYWLLNGDVTGLKLGAGIFFLLYSVIQLTRDMLSLLAGRAKAANTKPAVQTDAAGFQVEAAGDAAAAGGTTSAVAASSSSAAVVDDREGLVVDGASHGVDVAPLSAASDATDATASTLAAQSPTAVAVAEGAATPDVATDHSAPAAVDASVKQPEKPTGVGSPACGGWMKPLSPAYSPKHMMGILAVASVGAGVLSGSFGTGGPPYMIAYSLLRLEKDILRGFSAVGCVLMVIRLSMYLGGENNVFDPANEWPIYLGIWVAGISGAMVGSRCRKWVHSESILRILLGIVFASSASMLGAFKRSDIGVPYLLFAGTWLGLMVAWFLRPQWMPHRLVAACSKRGNKK